MEEVKTKLKPSDLLEIGLRTPGLEESADFYGRVCRGRLDYVENVRDRAEGTIMACAQGIMYLGLHQEDPRSIEDNIPVLRLQEYYPEYEGKTWRSLGLPDRHIKDGSPVDSGYEGGLFWWIEEQHVAGARAAQIMGVLKECGL